MNKTLKKISASVLTSIMLFQSMPASASNSNKLKIITSPVEADIMECFEEKLDFIAESTINLLAEQGQFIDVSKAEIGTPFKVATDQEYTDNVFPIMYNGEIILTASITRDENFAFVSIDRLYNEVLNESSGNLLFFASEGNIYVDNDGDIDAIALYNYEYTEDELQQLDSLSDAIEEFSYRMPDELPEAATDFSTKINPTSPIASLPSVATTYKARERIIVIPVVYQDRANTCWAAVSSSIIENYTNKTYTPSGICRQIHGFTHESGCNGGLIPDDIYKALTTLGPIKCDRYFTKFKYHEISNHIGIDRNIVVGHGEINPQKGHEVIINGVTYNYTNPQKEWVLHLTDSIAGEVVLDIYQYGDIIEPEYFIYRNYKFEDTIYIRER